MLTSKGAGKRDTLLRILECRYYATRELPSCSLPSQAKRNKLSRLARRVLSAKNFDISDNSLARIAARIYLIASDCKKPSSPRAAKLTLHVSSVKDWADSRAFTTNAHSTRHVDAFYDAARAPQQICNSINRVSSRIRPFPEHTAFCLNSLRETRSFHMFPLVNFEFSRITWCRTDFFKNFLSCIWNSVNIWKERFFFCCVWRFVTQIQKRRINSHILFYITVAESTLYCYRNRASFILFRLL